MSNWPEGWRMVALGDVAKVASGGTPNRQNPSFWGGDVPWVTTGEIQFNTITDTAQKITRLGLARSSAQLFPPGALLLAMYGQGRTRGQVARLGIGAATNQACAGIQTGPDCDAEYLYQFLAVHYDQIRAMGHAGTQHNLNTRLIRAIRLPLPPLPEQKRIAQIANTWDLAMTTSRDLLSNSQAQRRALMIHLLGGHWEARGQADSWSRVDFEQVFERITRRNTKASGEVLTISAQHGLVSQQDFFNKRVAGEDLSDYIHLSTGDFAYNKSASSGYPLGVIKPLLAYESGVVSSFYICFRSRPGVEVDNDFYRLYFEAGMLNDALTGIAQEGARSHGMLNISVRDFFKLPLPLPPIGIQRRIASVLLDAEAQERVLAGHIEALRIEKLVLMQDLLAARRRLRRAKIASTPTPIEA